MSLLAITLVVGILVDDAIVVIENIHRHMEMGKNRMQAAYDGLREIGGTIVSITLVLVVVFIPISLNTGDYRQCVPPICRYYRHCGTIQLVGFFYRSAAALLPDLEK